MDVLTFMEEILSAPSVPALRTCFSRTLSTLGVPEGTYNGSGEMECIQTGALDDRGATNPTNPLSRQSVPVLWSKLKGLSPQEDRFLRLMIEDHRARDGATIPLSKGNLEMVRLSFYGPVLDSEYIAEHLHKFHLLAVQFHTAYTLLSKPQKRQGVSLTARERDILLWCLHGKSKWVIGEILALSEHGVDYHLRKIYRKLGVASRTQAIAQAILLGLIQP